MTTLVGVALLAVPTIRINEQGRLIARVQSLQRGIETLREALEQAELADERRDLHQKSLDQREGSLAAALNELAGRKGAWTPVVHYTLYTGYVLLLAAALARVLG